MFNNLKILAVIPARGGSKGVPRKNIRELGDKPLIAWTINAAQKSEYIDLLVLSSEDEEIIAVAKKYGCEAPFRRPNELATDNAPGIEPVLHAVKEIGLTYDYLVLLQPTSPFRTTEDIDGAIVRCLQYKADSCVSVSQAQKHPAWMHTLDQNEMLIPWMDVQNGWPRQQLETVYTLNGAVYVIKTSVLLEQRKFIIPGKTLAYPMPPERSLDIDSEFDFLLCQLMADTMGEK